MSDSGLVRLTDLVLEGSTNAVGALVREERRRGVCTGRLRALRGNPQVFIEGLFRRRAPSYRDMWPEEHYRKRWEEVVAESLPVDDFTRSVLFSVASIVCERFEDEKNYLTEPWNRYPRLWSEVDHYAHHHMGATHHPFYHVVFGSDSESRPVNIWPCYIRVARGVGFPDLLDLMLFVEWFADHVEEFRHEVVLCSMRHYLLSMTTQLRTSGLPSYLYPRGAGNVVPLVRPEEHLREGDFVYPRPDDRDSTAPYLGGFSDALTRRVRVEIERARAKLCVDPGGLV